ncbi:XRE family transcriptional regulator [Sphaerisporangium album]|uniref:XRE family transcriptional regulator n=2 Tax=Sphaerisporangium album TaxID=509200 RepID=A0A367FJX3_9ACTN|nr:XRE family transcriptional regulator [Sphaerisporangium album]
MERRAVMQLLAAISAGAVIPAGTLETVLSGIEHALSSHTDVDEWEATVQEYDESANVRPIGSLIPDLTADMLAVGRLLGRGNPPLVQAGLMRVSAGLGWLLAAQLEDIGDRRAARVTWGTTRRAADASGDRDMAVWVRSKEASMARWSNRPPTVALTLANEAISIANGHPSKGLVQAYVVRSCLAARRADARETETELNALAETSEHLGWSRWLYRGQGYAYSLLGDRRAETVLDHALALYPPDATDHIASLRMIQAMGMVREREITEGLEHALTNIRTPMSAQGRFVVGEILTALPEKARNLPAAQELRALTA